MSEPDRAALVEGRAHGDDHAAQLDSLLRPPKTRPCVVHLQHTGLDANLGVLDNKSIRAVRCDWTHPFLACESNSEQCHLANAAELLKRVASLGRHV
jgi:hypothetical protein